MYMKKDKKGVSPVISTILLITIEIIQALIILLWTRGFTKEAYLKTIGSEEKPVSILCTQLKSDIEPFVGADNSFGFRNKGTIPIYEFDLRLTSNDGNTNIDEYNAGVGGGSINPGGMITFENKDYTNYKEVKVIPTLLATKKSGGDPEPVPCSSKDAIKL